MKKKRGFWGRMPEAAVFDPRPSAEAKVVLMAFATHANAQGRCWPSLESIADRLGIKIRMVQRHTKLLRELGYLAREGTMRTDEGYWVKVWQVLYPDPETSPQYVSEQMKTSPDDASKTHSGDTETHFGDTKTYSQCAPYIELAQKNTLLRTRSLEGAHFTPRQAAASDDDDAQEFESSDDRLDEGEFGFEGYDDEDDES